MELKFDNIKFGYFVSGINIEDWKIEEGLNEEPVFGKNNEYYFTLGDNHDTSDIAMFISEVQKNVIEKISYEEIKVLQRNIQKNIELYRNIKTNEFTGIVKVQ